jgi:pimeloyl-ACP methyl ester carboxylesterase
VIVPPPLFHSTWGAGPLVVALHGLGASSAYWDPLAHHLPHRRFVAPDALGFGRSPAPDHSRYDLDAHLEGVGPLLSEPATIVGHSTGCLLALGAAARWPGLVRHLVLTGLPAWPDRPTALDEVGRLGAMARWTASGDRRGRLMCQAMCRHRALAATLAPLVVRSVPAGVAIDGVRHTWTSYHRTLTNLVLAEPAARLAARTSCTISVIVGRDDRVCRPHFALRLSDHDRRLSMQVLEGVDHHPALRVPHLVAASIS